MRTIKVLFQRIYFALSAHFSVVQATARDYEEELRGRRHADLGTRENQERRATGARASVAPADHEMGARVRNGSEAHGQAAYSWRREYIGSETKIKPKNRAGQYAPPVP